LNLFNKYDIKVDKAYIVRIEGNSLSETKAERCAESCDAVGQKWEYWDAYNGISDPIIVPKHNGQFINLLKVTDHYMTRGEVACALSHISLWVKCVEQDKPIVILEHDSVMVKAYNQHAVFNSICYLGNCEQAHEGWAIVPTPPHASEGQNKHFIARAHAYAIDSAIAKNLLSHVLKYGISAPLDIMIRADIFPIHQMGIFAYDIKDADTTILGRPKKGRSTERNDNLGV
jgi:hypothetical protein